MQTYTLAPTHSTNRRSVSAHAARRRSVIACAVVMPASCAATISTVRHLGNG